ncbi:YihY/virulence factor BrkB family protein [Paraflavitalea speifideaquila]|uniref:YihY/virulence factor BrkB family protein n=1 Tax=Paraflavitalea speifideaquila TaxID=3076558 RepID=UPI0028E3FFB8|nr:YhjD/YihY/BrkB family envelope integrity protein [Paraflavitalea speifideiaquila]
MAAATAFFTTFALPAILIILIQIFGLIMGRRAIGHQLFTGLTDILGPNAVEEMRATLRNVRLLTQSWYIAAAVFIFLLFVATTLFKVIRDSLNQLWEIRVKEGVGIKFQLRQRGRSFVVILLAGILFLAVLLVEGTFSLLPDKVVFLVRVFKQLVSVIAATAWFTILFKYIADGFTSWKVTLAGAFFTGMLFTLGKNDIGVTFIIQYHQEYLRHFYFLCAAPSFCILLLLHVLLRRLLPEGMGYA